MQQLTTVIQASSPGVTEIRLDPVELGRVILTLTSGESGLTVVVNADRPETADLVRRHLESLSAELRQIGYGAVSYSFTNSGSGSGPDRGQAAERADAGGSEPAPEQTGRTSTDRRVAGTADGTLDIRI
ncbi:flagellar hook-length control protein FliK [Histidinibacterium lentulum]|uniref:flagellar hook-length control protein FliK n=1 Tax=Histidinibacterium lentulum TaxID=2480588 RepID=UPI00160C3DDF|nr:flagellar hook-length control protein FliK [Histidinibacterium lentulum]